MKNQISTEQIERYQRDGFLAIDDFLNADELERWRAVTDDAVQTRLDETGAGGKPGASYYAQVFTQCIGLGHTHQQMRELIFDPRLGEVAATLAGVAGVRIWHDQALIKPPYGNPTAWHLDNPYWSFSSDSAVSIWVALDDATLANGCLWYLPGTQQTARSDNPGIGENMRDIFKLYPEWETIEAVATPLPAGGVVFHNGLVAHGAGANMTPRPRRAMTCGYMPDGSTFNGTKNILPDEYFQSLKVGDVLDNDEQNPLVWAKEVG